MTEQKCAWLLSFLLGKGLLKIKNPTTASGGVCLWLGFWSDKIRDFVDKKCQSISLS